MANENATVKRQLRAQNASTELLVAHDAACAAAAVLTDYFTRGVAVRAKSPQESYNLVSDADVEAERAIATRISHTYPEHDILGEEEQRGHTSSGNLWIIDPLDGTNTPRNQEFPEKLRCRQS